MAMLLQVLTPVLAVHSMAAAATVDRAAAPICGSAGDGVPSHHATHRAGHRQGHEAACMACPFCSAAHFAIPASMPAPPLPAVQGYVAHLIDPTASPRGPPLFRPKARAPPAFS